MKTSSDEAKTILAMLPERLEEETVEALIRSAMPDLGEGEFLLFRRESWCNSFDYEIGFPLEEEEEKPKWAAFCRCGACGEEWHSGWREGYGIRMAEGEDGMLYPGIPETYACQREVGEEDKVNCPFCDANLTAVSTASLKKGRTYRVLMGRMSNLETRSAMLFWMLQRKVDKNGRSGYSALPWAAVVVGTDGKIYRFTHTESGVYGKRTDGKEWRESPNMGEPIRQRYYAWGCFNNTCMGGYYQTDIPEQAGMSGEKTGLADYIAGGGEFPLAYLLRQKRWPGLENLVKAGWTYTIDSCIVREIEDNTRMGHYLGDAIVLRARKPKDMLGMSRQEVRMLAGRRWDYSRAAAWKRCTGLGAEEFEALAGRYGEYEVGAACSEFGAEGLRKLDRYLQYQKKKQRETRTGRGASMTLYRDYRRMLAANGGGDTPIELWPPNLQAAHDRQTEISRLKESKTAEGEFRMIRETWGELEWSDGEICAVLPLSEGDLIREGRKLNHCVGSYGKAHVGGRIIVFIRHARRPERSWYTLNIDTTGKEWQEVQLHGYGNEYANGKRLTIPGRVRDFVDRWEREILTPVFREVKQAGIRNKTSKEDAA